MAERSKTFRPSATLPVAHASPRFIGAADARIESDGRGGKFSSLQGPEKSQNAEIVAPYSAARTPRPYAVPNTAAAFTRSRARSIVLRYLFEFAVSAPDGTMGGEENSPTCKALKSLKTRKSSPDNPRRDSPPPHYSQHPNRLDELGRRLQPDRVEMVSSMSRLSYRHLSLFPLESEHAHIRRMSLQAVAL